MSNTARSITLHLAGETLSLKTDRDPQALQLIADSVGERVDEIRNAARGIPSHKVYLLVALQLADELFAERENSRALCDEVLSRSQRVLDMVDAELAQLPSRTAENGG